jgi:sterol-4alpha-carboxylate 3-dehydrogenase (decarboxylating)
LGPGDKSLVPSIHACIARGETRFIIGSGVNLYDFTYVDNVAHAHVLAVDNLLSEEKTAAGEAFFISNCEPIPFWDFLRAVWAEFDHVPAFQIRIPQRLAWIAGYLAEWFDWLAGTHGSLNRGAVKEACMTAYADCSKAQRILGYKPRIGLVEGLKISCEVCFSTE